MCGRRERRFHWLEGAGGGGGAGTTITTGTPFFCIYRMKSSVLGVLLFMFGGMISCTVNVAKPTSGMFSVERVRPFVPMVPLKDHHFVASQTNQILHFPKLREQENLLQKKNQLEEIRLKAVEKRASKLTPVEHFEECCSRSPPLQEKFTLRAVHAVIG